MSKKSGREPKPPVWVSQNFLTSNKTIKRLLDRTTINIDDHVIEIGPGKGHITAALVKTCRKVTAVEIDKKLYDRLLKNYGRIKNLIIYHKDFLQWEPPLHEKYKVFANIPFCHATAILRKLTESKNPPTEAWLTMEKGAAKRFSGKPYETFQSLMLKPMFDLEIVYYFLQDDFHPKPAVDVVLVHIKKKIKPDVAQSRWRKYRRFISSALQDKGTGLRRVFTKKQLSYALRSAKICDVTQDQILYVQWLCLFRCYCEYVLHIKP